MKEVQYISGDFLAPRDAWDTLSLEEQVEMIKAAVSEGIFNLKDIRKKYNEFAEGGDENINNKPKFRQSQEAYYDKETDTVYAPDSTGEFYYHEMFHARPDTALLNRLKPFYENLNDTRLKELGADLPFVKRIENDPGHFYSPEEIGARVSAARYMLNNAGVSNIDNVFLEKARKNENAYGDNFRDLLHMYNNENLIGIFGNGYSSGGKIYIKPENRGKFTALKERTGHSATWFKEHGTPAQKKMATFALNSRKWKHGEGGPLFSNDVNIYGFGDWLNKARGVVRKLGLDKSPAQHIIEFFSNNEESEEQQPKKQTITYRNRPATRTLVKTKDGSIVMTLPARQRDNNSQTQERSQKMEGQMNIETYRHQQKSGGSNPAFDIPFIPEKAIILNGSTTSTNVLDSLAKYAGIHNRDPRLSEHPIMLSSKYKAPRTINKNEMLGLAAQETKNGAMPYYNFTDGDAEYNRALANSNYFTSYGFIPADNIVRNFHYNDADVDRNTPPLLDAFRYFAQGDYNRGDKRHTSDVNTTGAKLWNDPKVKEWWEKSGKYWYNYGHGPQKKENKEQKKQSLQLRYYEKNEPRIVP